MCEFVPELGPPGVCSEPLGGGFGGGHVCHVCLCPPFAQVTRVAAGRSWSGACELPGARIARLAAPAGEAHALLLHEG